MLQNKMTMLILSCELFSDLWDAHVKQLEKFWPDRGMDTYIVTDAEHPAQFERVKVMATGAGLEFSERLAIALEQVDSEYVFITLDDYFLRKQVSNEKITGLVSMMDAEGLDYVRLFKRPTKATGKQLQGYPGVYGVNTERVYSVNLYSGIWRTSFMKKTVRDVRDPWRFEVSLAKIAKEMGAKCAVSLNRDFVILDVVRKGKILNKANRYLKKHDLYHGPRPVQSRWYEFKLGVRTWGGRLMPDCIVRIARNFMIKRGHRYFSQDN